VAEFWGSLHYDACFFCIGVTSIGKDKATYKRLTYDLTIDFAKLLVGTNSGMTFCYISGAYTDSSEKGGAYKITLLYL
jgi:hypothetical protein